MPETTITPAPGTDRRERFARYAAAVDEVTGGTCPADILGAVLAVADREQQQLRDELADARGILAVLRARVDDAGSLMTTSYVRSALDGDDAIPEPRNPSSAP